MNRCEKVLYSPFLVQLVVTRGCNLSCAYCNEFERGAQPVPYERLIRSIDKAHDIATLALEFTGGEPLLHPRICDLVAYATARGVPYRLLITNATLLTEDLIKRLNDAGLDKMQISLDAVHVNPNSRKVLDELRDRLDLLANCAEFRVTLSSVIGVAPVSETVEVAGYALSRGFLPRVILQHGKHGEILARESDLETLGMLRDFLGSSYSEAGNYRERLLLEGRAPFKCRAGSRYIYVNEQGDAMCCSQCGDKWKKNFLELTLEDMKSNFRAEKSCNDVCSIGCARTCSSWDEWRPQ